MAELRKARHELADIIDWKSPDSSSTSTTNTNTSTNTGSSTINIEYLIDPHQEHRAVEILRSHPCLASEFFSDYRPLKNKYTPLSFLVENNASLNVIEEVFNLHQGAISSKDRWGNHPLHCACRARADPDVLAFLMDQYSDAVAVANRVGYYPLHFLMVQRSGRPLTKQAIDVILPANKTGRIALEGQTELGLTPLQLALMKSNTISPDVLEYLFQVAAQQQKDCKPFSLQVHKIGGGCLNLSHAKAIAKILPRLDSFTYLPSSDAQAPQCKWTDEAFCFLLQAISNDEDQHNNIESLTLELPRRQLEINSQACGALRQLFANNLPNLQSISLKGDDDDDPNILCHDDACMDSIAQGFASSNRPNNSTMESLTLMGIFLQTSRTLSTILSGPRQPKQLKLLDVHVVEPWISCDLTSCQCVSLHLHLFSSAMSEWQIGLIRQLSSVPKLERLSLECIVDGPNLTPCLVDLLKNSNTLLNLQLMGCGCHVNHEQVAKALHTNYTFTTYACDTRMYMDPTIRAAIAYHTNFNKYGRARVRAANCSKSELVNLIGAAATAGDAMDQMETFNVHFGLLSLVPSLWNDAKIIT